MRHGPVAVELDLVQPVLVLAGGGAAPAWRAAARCAAAPAPCTAPGSAPGLRAAAALAPPAAGFGGATSSSIRRPDFTLSGRAARMSSSGRRPRSCSLNSSQFFLLVSPGFGFSRASIQPPLSFSPARRNLKAPVARLFSASSIGAQTPVSQTIIGPPPYSPLRNDALEVDVFERMVLGLHRQPLVGGIERRPLRHRPALQHPADLEPEIVVVGRRVVLVDDEAVARRQPCRRRAAPPSWRSRAWRDRCEGSALPCPAG